MESVSDSAPICPLDMEEIAEAYCMGRLPGKERSAFEDHFIIYPRCTYIVARADEYVRAMKKALRRLCPSAVRLGS